MNNATGSVMMICPNLKCRKVLAVPEKFRGQQVKCQFCSTTFAVPTEKRQQESASSDKKV